VNPLAREGEGRTPGVAMSKARAIVAQLSPLQSFLVCSRVPQLKLRRGGTMPSCVSSRGTCREVRPFCRPGVRSRRTGGRARGMSGASSGHVALQRACYFKARTGAAPVFLLIFTGRCGAKMMREACLTFGVQSKPLPLHFRCCLQRRCGATGAGVGASYRADCASPILGAGSRAPLRFAARPREREVPLSWRLWDQVRGGDGTRAIAAPCSRAGRAHPAPSLRTPPRTLRSAPCRARAGSPSSRDRRGSLPYDLIIHRAISPD
jgi:hypothetical protein